MLDKIIREGDEYTAAAILANENGSRIVEIEPDEKGRRFKIVKNEPSDDEIKANMRAVRNMLLIVSDKYALPDFPETDEERKEYYEYRQYLRDYPNDKKSSWWENPPLDFDDWRKKDDEKR